MGKTQIVLVLAVVCLLSSCGPQLIPIDDDDVILDPSVMILFPQDQDSLGPYHAAVVAAANVPGGISGMEFSIDGNPPAMYEFPANQIGNNYVETHAYWFPAHTGSTILSVVVFNMNGQPAASDQIEVFVEFESVDNGGIETKVAMTLTAYAQGQQELPAPIPTETPTPAPLAGNSPCELFSPEETKLTLLDIQPGSNQLTYFLTFGMEVPGLEKREAGDKQEYAYFATLGSAEPVECTYQGYSKRLYCTSTLPERELNSVQPLSVELNLCDHPIFFHAQVSLIAPVCTAESEQSECEAFGGTYSCVRDVCSCACP